MKENRKLLKEVLKDIRHDMTDEEVLNLLRTVRFQSVLKAERKSTPWGSVQQMQLQNLQGAGHSFFLLLVSLFFG